MDTQPLWGLISLIKCLNVELFTIPNYFRFRGRHLVFWHQGCENLVGYFSSALSTPENIVIAVEISFLSGR